MTLAHWERYGFGIWTVRDPATQRFTGRGGPHRVTIDGREEVEIGYALMPEFWGRGLATELARESVAVAFTVLALPELICFTLAGNHASRRVMEKVGFRYERDIMWAGEPHVLHRQTATAWRSQPPD
jgi:RimJ/RimL family protein N-acetyltransferase